MDLIASALQRDKVVVCQEDPRSDAARHCLNAYYGELARRFDTGYDVNLAADTEASDMILPRGVFLLAWADGAPLGCVAVKGHGGRTAEIKRLWTAPHARRLGVGKRLMSAAEEAARGLGIELLRLDTNSALPEAERLYRTSGWQEIDRFNDDPYPDLFFEKRL